MAGKDFVIPADDGCILRVDVTTGAKKTEIAGVNRWRGTIRVRLAAEPVKGRANRELIRFLSERLSIDMESISIVSGHASTQKEILLPVDAGTVIKHLDQVV